MARKSAAASKPRKLNWVPFGNGHDLESAISKWEKPHKGMYSRPKREQFKSQVDYLKFKAWLLRGQAERLEARADDIEKYGDPKTRAKVNRAAKLAEKLAEMKAELESAGVEI